MINLIFKIKAIIIALLAGFGVAFGIYQTGKSRSKKEQQLNNAKDNAEYFKTAIKEKEEIDKLNHDELVDSILHKHSNNL